VDRGVNAKKSKGEYFLTSVIAFLLRKAYTCIMMNRLQTSKKRCSGQAMVEYIIVFIAMLLVISVLALSLYTVRQQANRTLDLVGSDYP
jgi:hypothetical protein